MQSTKISVIGAGSGAFSLSIVRNLCLTPNLAGSTVSFMDINPERLDAVATLCRRYAGELGAKLTVEQTQDRKESLRGADFVINTALTAGHDRLREGWRIALRHGFRFPGSYHILYDEPFWVNFYQLRFFESLTEDMLAICPQAWHLMVANPVVAGTTHLLRKYPAAKMVGLCHGYAEALALGQRLAGTRERLTYEVAGVNHFVWLTHLYHEGRDLRPALGEAAACAPWGRGHRENLHRLFGVHPIGDTCGWSGALWPWWNNTETPTEEGWKDDPEEQATFWDGYFNGVAKHPKDIARIARDASLTLTEVFPPERDDELVVPLIESLACDLPRVFILNLQNSNEFVAGLPRDFEVEIPALASKRGIQGIKTSPLPKEVLLHTLRDRVVPVEMELQAYTTGRRDLLVQLILMDKWATSMTQAEAFLEETLSLPYHEEMRRHYR